jgi:hypothetical protein
VINLITSTKRNLIIALPTGTGKNIIIINSIQNNHKYLILVPRIFLMEQIKLEIINYKKAWKNKIQMIGDNNNIEYNKNKNITICVFNSVYKVKDHSHKFHKIYVDEAHHINIPNIYKNDNKTDKENNNEANEDNEDNGDNEDYNDVDIKKEKYKNYFLSADDVWENKLKSVQECINKYKKIPNYAIDRKLTIWFTNNKVE